MRAVPERQAKSNAPRAAGPSTWVWRFPVHSAHRIGSVFPARRKEREAWLKSLGSVARGSDLAEMDMFRFLQGSVAAIVVVAAACDRPPPDAAAKAEQTGVASFYGREFSGKETASGETLKLDAMTAASRTLPLGTRVEVTNVETGESAQVRINDRGPYAKGRVLDLTPRAARHIGIDRDDGVAPVSIKPISTPPSSNSRP
jgi:rare lipoprotein A